MMDSVDVDCVVLSLSVRIRPFGRIPWWLGSDCNITPNRFYGPFHQLMVVNLSWVRDHRYHQYSLLAGLLLTLEHSCTTWFENMELRFSLCEKKQFCFLNLSNSNSMLWRVYFRHWLHFLTGHGSSKRDGVWGCLVMDWRNVKGIVLFIHFFFG